MGEVVAMQPSFFTEVSTLITEDRHSPGGPGHDGE